MWCHIKSSMDPTDRIMGRPFGGVGFVCKRSSGLVFRAIECQSDRITAIEIFKNGSEILHVIGVYLPYDDHSVQQTELYLETIGKVQCLIDKCNDDIPVIIMGDMNASIPKSDHLFPNWYKHKPYNKRSAILYEFLCDNNLSVCNYVSNYCMDYTYIKGKSRSYIDHIFVPKYMSVRDSDFQCDSPDNVSDHLPVSVTVYVPIKGDPNTASPSACPTSLSESVPLPWHNETFQQLYSQEVTRVLDSVEIPHIDSVNKENAADVVDTLCEQICAALHKSINACKSFSTNTRFKKSKRWWTLDCKRARERNKLFHYIWKCLGKPTAGEAYACYKAARRVYRKACRYALKNQIHSKFKLIEKYSRNRDSKRMWNLVRQTRKGDSSNCAISMETLVTYFTKKLTPFSGETDSLREAGDRAKCYHEELSQITDTKVLISVCTIRNYIKRLKPGSSAGVDRVTPEHLKHAMDSKLPLLLSVLLSLCLRHGVVPQSFTKGILVPILKKKNLDPTLACNYRPITISTILSKLLEYYILDQCSDFQFNPSQFGFVKNRSTQMATALAHDVCAYSVASGSPVFACSLDAEGAFDALPHSVILDKAIGVIPAQSWNILHNWYANMCVFVRWNNQLGKKIPVRKGTRQGGLTSPYLYNLYYKNLIDELNDNVTGVVIGDNCYNAFCYADDILLCSTTITGLQNFNN